MLIGSIETRVSHIPKNHLGVDFFFRKSLKNSAYPVDMPWNHLLRRCLSVLPRYARQFTSKRQYPIYAFGAASLGALLASDTEYTDRLKKMIKLCSVQEVLEASPIKDNDDKDDKRSSKSMSFNFIADAVEKTAPSVVHIEVTSRAPPNIFGQQSMGVSSGSGFIVSEDGMILTNAHVVNQSTRVDVKLPDGRSFTGCVVDVDPVTDLAAVRLMTTGKETFPHLNLASSTVRVGEWVAALGSPLRLSNTVTAGIVSSLHRDSGELGLKDKNMTYIQTDAAINIGNSGGPLINLDGEVIGINCITVAQASGISFAIPADVAREFLNGALKKGLNCDEKSLTESSRANQRFFIGITMLTLTPAILSELQHRSQTYFGSIEGGVLVARVTPGSPADRAGFKTGDVITSIGGRPMESAPDVHSEVKKGAIMKMEVHRGGKRITLEVSPIEIMSRL